MRGGYMEDIISAVSDAVSSIGFPIVVSGALFWFMNKSNDTHKQEIEKLSEAVNNNTKVVQELIIKLKKDKQ